MTTQDSPVDLAATKQALVEIVLRMRAEAQTDEASADGPGEGPGSGPGDAGLGAPAAQTGGAGKPAVSPVWAAMLTTYGREWNGKKDTWTRYRAFMEMFARDRGVIVEATNFFNTAEQLPDDAARIKFFAAHGVVIDGAKSDGSEPDPPKQDADGRQVDMVLATAKESDGTGDFLWVRVDGRAGRIYLKTRKFVEEDNPRFADVPTTDSRDRKITLVKPATGKGEYTVRIEELWGRINAATRVFTAERPDDSAFGDWSSRGLIRDGYADGGNSESGRWYQPWDDKKVYLFLQTDDTRQWAKGEQLTSTTLGGVQQRVEDVVKDWVTRYPDQL